ncbi:MAG: hypothetical protein M1831_002859 [Alyxoria varia]|nr:MAG: hypothetical protein M1831_002859 [Alyxoria varia]
MEELNRFRPEGHKHTFVGTEEYTKEDRRTIHLLRDRLLDISLRNNQSIESYTLCFRRAAADLYEANGNKDDFSQKQLISFYISGLRNVKTLSDTCLEIISNSAYSTLDKAAAKVRSDALWDRIWLNNNNPRKRSMPYSLLQKFHGLTKDNSQRLADPVCVSQHCRSSGPSCGDFILLKASPTMNRSLEWLTLHLGQIRPPILRNNSSHHTVVQHHCLSPQHDDHEEHSECFDSAGEQGVNEAESDGEHFVSAEPDLGESTPRGSTPPESTIHLQSQARTSSGKSLRNVARQKYRNLTATTESHHCGPCGMSRVKITGISQLPRSLATVDPAECRASRLQESRSYYGLTPLWTLRLTRRPWEKLSVASMQKNGSEL